jgi:hypothetical protein
MAEPITWLNAVMRAAWCALWKLVRCTSRLIATSFGSVCTASSVELVTTDSWHRTYNLLYWFYTGLHLSDRGNDLRSQMHLCALAVSSSGPTALRGCQLRRATRELVPPHDQSPRRSAGLLHMRNTSLAVAASDDSRFDLRLRRSPCT